MELNVLKIDGSSSGKTVKLNPTIFEVTPNDHAIYMDVRSIMANQHLGLHKVKARSEVRGGGKKPWKQKGRGGARAGSTRTGVWVGGGSIFGPPPHDYIVGINKKMKRAAKLSALSYKAKDNSILVVENFSFDAPKTKSLVSVLEKLSISGKKTLLLTAENNPNVYLSGRNIQKVFIKPITEVSTYDLVNSDVILFQEQALTSLERVLA